MKAIMPLLLGALFLMGCSPSAKSHDMAESEGHSTACDERELALPEVPEEFVLPRERAAYVLAHFWDSMDFSDTSRSLDTAFMEQNFANFASLLPHVDADAVSAAAESVLKKAASCRAAYDFFMDIAEKYLYNPNSPMRDEIAYAGFADVAISQNMLDEASRARVEYQRECALKNRAGSTAADFAYERFDGSCGKLHDFCAGSALTLLLFYDPECEICHQTIEALASDDMLTSLASSGRLRVLAVYPDGEKELWRRHASDMPKAWTLGIDYGNIEDRSLYAFPALPSLYLLDRSSKVLLKDAAPQSLLMYLFETTSRTS